MDFDIGSNLFHLMLFSLFGIFGLIFLKTFFYDSYYSMIETKGWRYDPNSKYRKHGTDIPDQYETYYSEDDRYKY